MTEDIFQSLIKKIKKIYTVDPNNTKKFIKAKPKVE